MNEEKCTIKQIWDRHTKYKFNDLAIGQIFRENNDCIVLGHEDGVLRTYSLPVSSENTQVLNCLLSLETKGGPIQTVAVHDVTRFGSKDVVVGDSRGMVTVFSNEQILTRKTVSEHCIQCLQVQLDKLGNQAILTGDTEGHLMAFSPYADLWRLRLSDIPHLKGLSSNPAVTSLHCTHLYTRHGQKMNYVLAADNCKHLFLLQNGTVVAVYNTPHVITAMASGKFLESSVFENGENNSAFDSQVALGCESGAVYLFTNFQVYHDEFSNVELPIRQLLRLPAADTQPTDSLLCAGHFTSLIVLRNGKVCSRYECPAWITCLELADVDKDNVPEIVIGCQNNTIQALKVQFS